MKFESSILETVGARNIPRAEEFPRWPQLALNTERIFDAMRNRELAYGKGGISCDDPSLLDRPDVTVRHVDLKLWMARCYPDQKPTFLFDAIERQLHPAISVEAVQSLLVDRESLRTRLGAHEKELEGLREEVKRKPAADAAVAPRSETTYLNIVGGLLTLLLGKSPSGNRYSSFETMDSVISALLAHHEGRPGISERTLWSKLAAAKRQVSTAPI